MGIQGDHISIKLVMPLLISDLTILDAVLDELRALWGAMDFRGELLRFEQSAYYDKEMGVPIYRAFYSFETLRDVTDLVNIKQQTNLIEESYAVGGKRRVNLDPGYMSPGKFVLATTKNQQHRLYIGKGIFEEITLFFHAGQWESHSWTYADYQSENYRRILFDIRKIYIAQVSDELKSRSRK